MKILYAMFYVVLHLAFMALLLHYFYLLEARHRLIRTKSLFDRAYFFHDRPYSFSGYSGNFIHLGPYRNNSRSDRAEALERQYLSEALQNALLELHYTSLEFPHVIFLNSSFDVSVSFSVFNPYPVERIDASCLLQRELWLRITGNPTLTEILLPASLKVLVDFKIIGCPKLQRIIFTCPPPYGTSLEEYPCIASGVSPDFCLIVPSSHEAAFRDSLFGSLSFIPKGGTRQPVPIRTEQANL